MLAEKIPDKWANIAYTLNSDTKQPVNNPAKATRRNSVRWFHAHNFLSMWREIVSTKGLVGCSCQVSCKNENQRQNKRLITSIKFDISLSSKVKKKWYYMIALSNCLYTNMFTGSAIDGRQCLNTLLLCFFFVNNIYEKWEISLNGFTNCTNAALWLTPD